MSGGFFARRPTADAEVEDSLNPLDRARKLGNSNHSYQRLVFVNELVDCAHEIGYGATVRDLLPLVNKLASDPEVLVRQSLVGKFGDLAGFLIQSDPELGYQQVVKDLLKPLNMLLTEKSLDVRQGAAEALIILASHLRPGEKGDQVLKTVISLSHNNDDEDARGTAVQLFNGLAEALGKDLCQQFIAIELIALCEDWCFRVRKNAASNFAEVARMVGDDYILSRLLPAFKKLVDDKQHWGVRKAAAESLRFLAEALDKKNREGPLVPLMNTLLNDNSRWVKNSALQQLGYFIASLDVPERVPDNLLTQYVEIIEQTKANPDAADIGYHCAYTFAAVAKTMGRARWDRLRGAFVSLCHDTQKDTRRAIAASLHVIAEALSSDLTEQEVLPQFESLILDEPEKDVRNAAVRNVASILKVAPGARAQQRISKVLQTALNKKDNNWRLKHSVASQLGTICEALGSTMETQQPDASPPVPATTAAGAAEEPIAAAHSGDSKSHQGMPWVVPLFLQLCSDGVAEVRDEAPKATAKVLGVAVPEMFTKPATSGTGEAVAAADTQPKKPPQPIKDLIQNFAKGKNFRHRMTFIRMCDSIIRMTDIREAQAPPRIFTEFLLRPLARLANDPDGRGLNKSKDPDGLGCRNVRHCWATTMLPHVRCGGRLGQIKPLVVVAARMAKADTDKEILKFLHGVQFHEFPHTPDDDEGQPSAEGGTGSSSECGDVVVGDEEEEEAEQPPTPTGQQRREDQTQHPAPSPLQPSPLPGGSSPHATTSPSAASAASTEGKSDSPTSSLEKIEHFFAGRPKVRQSPRSENQSPTALSPSNAASPAAPPSFDPVEENLIQQSEVNREMDRIFVERRLLAEPGARTEADAEASAASPSSAIASSPSSTPTVQLASPTAGAAAAPAAPAAVGATADEAGLPTTGAAASPAGGASTSEVELASPPPLPAPASPPTSPNPAGQEAASDAATPAPVTAAEANVTVPAAAEAPTDAKPEVLAAPAPAEPAPPAEDLR